MRSTPRSPDGRARRSSVSRCGSCSGSGPAGARGGPKALSQDLAGFFFGINDPFPGGNPIGAPFRPDIFHLYDAWGALRGHGPVDESRAAIARGEKVFNETIINITKVAGINDNPLIGMPENFNGACATCHRYAERRQSLGTGAVEHQHRQCRGEQTACLGHLGVATAITGEPSSPVTGRPPDRRRATKEKGPCSQQLDLRSFPDPPRRRKSAGRGIHTTAVCDGYPVKIASTLSSSVSNSNRR